MKGNLKSQDLLHFFRVLLEDAQIEFPGLERDFGRDWVTLEKRSASEGLTFLVKTLPLYTKDIILGLETGRLSSLAFKKSGKTAIPRLFKGLLRQVFAESGVVLESANPRAIYWLRQLGEVFYKLEVPYEEDLERAFVDRFLAHDSALPDDLQNLSGRSRSILDCAKGILDSALKGIDLENISPQHGPGAVASGEKPHEKMRFRRFFPNLDAVYCYADYFFLNPQHLAIRLKQLERMVVTDPYSRMALVPKDSRGPRIIAMEPLELMWIQQGIKKTLYKWIESHPLTKGVVNFTDQGINRALAQKASLGREYATIDMKDASDSVSLALVEYLYKDTIYPYLYATRSLGVELPKSRRRVTFKKFAPMGSALCFPIEALTFWALAAAIQHVECGMPLLLACRKTFVYGDDIIIASSNFEEVVAGLPNFSLLVNKQKSFVHGYFRESCGLDAYKGVIVSPIRIKHLAPSKRQKCDARTYFSLIDMQREFFAAGLRRTANFLLHYIQQIRRTLVVREIDPALPFALVTDCMLPSRYMWPNKLIRYNVSIQQHEVKIWYPGIRKETGFRNSWKECFRAILGANPGVTYSLPRTTYFSSKWVTLPDEEMLF